MPKVPWVGAMTIDAPAFCIAGRIGFETNSDCIRWKACCRAKCIGNPALMGVLRASGSALSSDLDHIWSWREIRPK